MSRSWTRRRGSPKRDHQRIAEAQPFETAAHLVEYSPESVAVVVRQPSPHVSSDIWSDMLATDRWRGLGWLEKQWFFASEDEILR